MSAAPTWTFEDVLPGGPAGAAFRAAVQAFEARLSALEAQLAALPALEADLRPWVAALLEIEEVQQDLHQLSTLTWCWTCVDSDDRPARRARARFEALRVRREGATVPVDAALITCAEDTFQALLGQPALRDLGPRLARTRAQAALRLPPAEESLFVQLQRDGARAWERLYQRRSSALRVTDPEGEVLGISQLYNQLSSPDPARRAWAFAAYEAAWSELAEDCAACLTHIYGARETWLDRVGMDPLTPPLMRFRLERRTLDAMMEAVARARPALQRYLAAKAQLSGVERLGWQDLRAPLGGSSEAMSWEEAAAFVTEHAGAWHPELKQFIAQAFAQRWVEAEDKPGKRPGAWCASLPRSGQSRVFMTFGGTTRSMITLAHELGHAFHNHVLFRRPAPLRAVTSTLAESASIFCETLVRDAALAHAEGEAERLAMLDARLSAGVSFLMDLPARFDFEQALHRMRREGELEPEALSAEMLACQKARFGEDSLSTWHPLYWCSKLHFYKDAVPFYNFPYTFGYLFAALIVQRAKAEGSAYHPRYVALLQRTGWDHAEPLARDLLGVDLGDPEVWWEGVAPLLGDLEAFEGLVADRG